MWDGLVNVRDDDWRTRVQSRKPEVSGLYGRASLPCIVGGGAVASKGDYFWFPKV